MNVYISEYAHALLVSQVSSWFQPCARKHNNLNRHHSNNLPKSTFSSITVKNDEKSVIKVVEKVTKKVTKKWPKSDQKSGQNGDRKVTKKVAEKMAEKVTEKWPKKWL